MRRIPGAILAAIMLAPAALLANNTRAQLLLDVEEARPGDTVLAGVHFRMAPGWHIYWRNAGDSGGPTTINWQLPEGVTAGEIQWPIPEKYSLEGFHNYVYHDEVVLLVPLTISDGMKPGVTGIRARLDWLECEKVCLPGSANVETTLLVGERRAPSARAGFLEQWKQRLPRTDAPPARAWWSREAEAGTRFLNLEWESAAAQVDFFPFENDDFEFATATERIEAADGKARLRVKVERLEASAEWPRQIAGLLVENPNTPETVAYEARLPVAEGERAAALPGAGTALPLMLLFAFLGGLILNVMPCVLPVISLKVLAFVNQSGQTPARSRRLGLVYTLGVLLSFAILAGIVVGIQQAGQLVSWGMQFTSPQFLVFMTVLLVLIALNLFGVFEVNIGGRALGSASALAGKEGSAGAFFHGILITLLATPCSAPFLGVALGFAFIQPAPVVVLMFLAIGLGLASPYLILSFKPQWAGFLPKPGPWMQRFKVAMGFPMLATAVWLFSMAVERFGPGGVLWLGLFLVFVGIAAWVYGEFVQRGNRRRGWAMATSAALLIGGYAFALETELQWRAPVVHTSAAERAPWWQVPDGIDWKPWSPEAVEEARAAGRPVLVDFTALWCPNCRVNKRTSIEIPSVRRKLEEIGAVALIGDFTDQPPDIAAELRRHNRAAVPLVLVYPADPNEPPEVLPELLRPGIVLSALERAANHAAN